MLRTRVSLAKAFSSQLGLPPGVAQWVCQPMVRLTSFRHLTWCMLETPTPHRHRRACFFVRHQLGWLSKRTKRSKLNTRHPLLSNVTSHCWHEGLRNLVCQLQRLTSCWQPDLRYPEFPEQWSRRGNDTALSVQVALQPKVLIPFGTTESVSHVMRLPCWVSAESMMCYLARQSLQLSSVSPTVVPEACSLTLFDTVALQL